MKHFILAASIALAFTSAQATNFGNTDNRDYSTTNAPSAHAGAASIAGASSVSEAKANAASLAAQHQSTDSSVERSGNSANDNKSQARGNSTSVSVDGDNYERSAPAVFAGNIPSVPTSCRLYLFGGGTNTSGAVSGSIPIGNDQTCLSIAKLNLMERATGFTVKEKQSVVCKVEGMAELATCKNLK